jgi:hypothetical protein
VISVCCGVLQLQLACMDEKSLLAINARKPHTDSAGSAQVAPTSGANQHASASSRSCCCWASNPKRTACGQGHVQAWHCSKGSLEVIALQQKALRCKQNTG